ncbi:class I SAM-dependent methyltransferase [Thalassococcus sp. BH17M4-6]|uniref:class I SAM-dependent methyltransferase n=1 Tax=Thalassococcus sp. BH17M4-6 TaxID=3413148 RepID=UPI003BE540FE
MNWVSRYYDRRVAAGADKGLFWQVGHTKAGKPITPDQFDAMLGALRAQLDLAPDTNLLELCCGNGVFTKPLAQSVARTLAVDFSPAMIKVAQAECTAPDLTYKVVDVKSLPTGLAADGPFDRVLMNAALQHFSKSEFRRLLTRLMEMTTPGAKMLFAFVPDAARRAEFDQRLNPGLALRLRRWLGRDLVTHWYGQDEVRGICADLGLSASFAPVDPAVAGAWYRHDILIGR